MTTETNWQPEQPKSGKKKTLRVILLVAGLVAAGLILIVVQMAHVLSRLGTDAAPTAKRLILALEARRFPEAAQCIFPGAGITPDDLHIMSEYIEHHHGRATGEPSVVGLRVNSINGQTYGDLTFQQPMARGPMQVDVRMVETPAGWDVLNFHLSP